MSTAFLDSTQLEFSPASATVAAAMHEGRVEEPLAGGLLYVSADNTEFVLGPWLPEGETGCLDCSANWRADTSGLQLEAGGTGREELLRWSATAELMVIQGTADPKSLRHRIKVLEYSTGVLNEYSFLAHPLCSSCAANTIISSATELNLTNGQPTLDKQLRVRTFDTSHVVNTLSDRRHGPVAHSYRDEQSPLSLLTAEIVAPGTHRREGGYGRSESFSSSTLAAYLEGCERVLGAYKQPGVPVIEGSYLEHKDHAVDPVTLGLHDDEASSQREFSLDRYTPDLKTAWVWAWSTLHRKPRLVPEHVAYWHTPAKYPKFIYETSNGCAVGGSLEEAALYGLYEVVERDAFLLSWYSKIRLRRIVGAEADPVVAHLGDELEEHGLELLLLDLTSDFKIPTALAVITAPDELVRAGLFPSLSLASATHPDGARAIRTALEECSTNALMYKKWSKMRDSVNVERCRPMLADHGLVRTLEDHTGLHGLPEARDLNEYLLHPSGEIDVKEFSGQAEPPEDVVQELRTRLETAHALGLDVLVVDQNAPYMTDVLPINAVKVLVPGTMPMTFGHVNRRTHGIKRLHRAQEILKGGVPWHSTGGIYPQPHPFP